MSGSTSDADNLLNPRSHVLLTRTRQSLFVLKNSVLARLRTFSTSLRTSVRWARCARDRRREIHSGVDPINLPQAT